MPDTFLCEMLRRGGCSQGQAAAFERCLEDRPICGVGTGLLTRALLAQCVSDMAIYVSGMRELQMEVERLRNVIAEDMFHAHNVADAL